MVAREYPVFGVGPANWRVIASQFGWPEGKSAHSVWMETSAELGFLGSLLLLTFFVTAAVKLWPLARLRMREGDVDGVLAFGAVLSIVGFVVGGQFVSVPGLELPYYVVMVGTSILKAGPTKPVVTSVKEPPFRYHPAALRLTEATRGLPASAR
jgi:O-antigen ligase